MNPAPLPIGKQFIEDLEPICADAGKRCKGTHPLICQDHGCAILAQRADSRAMRLRMEPEPAIVPGILFDQETVREMNARSADTARK